MREYLAKIDWNNTLKNKTATECWNILKSEIDCVVDKFVPLKDHLVDFLVKNKLINPSQHGFLKARSCLTNMLFFGRCHKVAR